MNLFDQYGIKEVAEVTISSVHKKQDGSGEIYYVPALYLDTLKVSSAEKTGDITWARGGLNNNKLVAWDSGKEIKLTFEDALCTPASLGLCWGGILGSDWKDGQINQTYGIKDVTECGGVEKIDRMEKAFYPRGDMATVSTLLPRDGSEDIIPKNGDPIYLQRSSILDGTVVKGFGYVGSHPYKWHLEIETGIKSVAVVPDRFFSIYGKSYPIQRRQTVGINQPSESFKYEIIYKRGYDKYNDEKYQAKIIYHKQAEAISKPTYVCKEDNFALSILDDMTNYPYLKIRVCHDGSIRAYLGKTNVDWDLERQITKDDKVTAAKAAKTVQMTATDLEGEESEIQTTEGLNGLKITDVPADVEKPGVTEIITEPVAMTASTLVAAHANNDNAWIEVPQINTDQFRNIDLWLRFESINALSYYLLTKYKDNIYEIGAKVIKGGLTDDQQKKVSTVQATQNNGGTVKGTVGIDYKLTTPKAVSGINDKGARMDCVPCCKKANLSRSIWAYINPHTMTPYDDDYWFHRGEAFYKKSLTLSTKEIPLKAKSILVNSGVFPGMYHIVGETRIRDREGHDKRVQLVFPLCKISSNQTFTLEADGEPTVFNLDVEVAVPENGIQMEITFYDVEEDTKIGCCGQSVSKDGSTRISAQ